MARQRDQNLPKAAWLRDKVCAISALWITQFPILVLANPKCIWMLLCLTDIDAHPHLTAVSKEKGFLCLEAFGKEVLEPALRKSVVNVALQRASCIFPHKTELAASTMK